MDKRIGPEAFHLYKHPIRLDAADAGALYAAKLRGVVGDRAPEPSWGSTRPPGPTCLGIARVQVCPILLIYSLLQCDIQLCRFCTAICKSSLMHSSARKKR